MEIEYRVGDIFDVKPTDEVVIAHIVNNVGAFGKGFASAVAQKWPHVKTHYHANFSWYDLGDVLLRDAEGDGRIVVANLFAQDGLPSKENPIPVRYAALYMALLELGNTLLECPEDYEVWMPRIGTGYGGGSWGMIETIVKSALSDRDIKVVVFDLPS